MWIYRGSAYAYSKDPDFAPIGDEKFWQKMIDQFNQKYEGIYNLHEDWIGQAQRTGYVVNHITGRRYKIEPKLTYRGLKWPEPDIVNYPNQGFGAEIAALVRVEERKRILQEGLEDSILPVLTVHDSLLSDCSFANGAWYRNIEIRDEIIRDLPKLVKQRFGYKLKVDQKLEHEVGVRYGWMHSIKNPK